MDQEELRHGGFLTGARDADDGATLRPCDTDADVDLMAVTASVPHLMTRCFLRPGEGRVGLVILDQSIDGARIGAPVIVLGIILILLAALLDVPPILYTIGIILVVIGVVLWILGAMDRAVGPRRHYW